MKENFRIGDIVKFGGQKMRIVSVSRSRKEHPGFDESLGSALYDLVLCCSRGYFTLSVYDSELVGA